MAEENKQPLVSVPRLAFRCKYCMKEARVDQVAAKAGGKVPLMWVCSTHGTLKITDIVRAYTG